MQRFEYQRHATPDAAARAVRGRELAQFIAGGTNLTDYMTLEVMRPRLLVDINGMAASHSSIEVDDQRLRLGALVRMAQAEDHPQIRSQFPVIHETLKLAASRQIRNMASLGGNVLQRTRCEYFRERSWPCNKRAPGSGCSALEGINRQHAILGTSDHCIAAYPGDFAQALVALDAIVETVGSASGYRRFPFAKLHVQPGHTPDVETTLAPGELITFIEVPVGPWTRRSRYVKVRDRESYQFAITSAAVALDMEDDVVREARIALGGVATVPWRAGEAERVLKGQPLTEALAERAAEAAFAGAQPRVHNAFKIPLGKSTLVRALLEAAAMELQS